MKRGTAIVLVLSALTLAVGSVRAEPAGKDTAGEALHGVFRLESGIVLPYPLDNLFRGWVECTGRGHHKALDIGGVGPDAGLGSVVRAMGAARITRIGLPTDDPERFGRPLTAARNVVRNGNELPAWKEVPGYGKVHFFTEDYGRHRSGGLISLRLVDGPLKGHEVHYLHIAAVRPGLALGDLVQAGDELGLLGGTAVLEASPHLHLTIEDELGKPLDVGRVLGIGATRVPCRAGKDMMAAIRARYSKAAKVLMKGLRSARALAATVPEPKTACGVETIEGDFADGQATFRHIVLEPVDEHPLAPVSLQLERVEGTRWTPRIQIVDQHGADLFTGTLTRPAAKRKAAFESRASGRRGQAQVIVKPKKPGPLTLKVMAWPTGNKRAYKGARWRLTIDRACP
jgi:hypothetical protein